MMRIILLSAVCFAADIFASTSIDAALDDLLRARGQASVVIVFEVTDAPAASDRLGRNARRNVVRQRTDEILEMLGETFRVSRRFEIVSALAGRLEAEGLERLRRQSGILSVGLDVGGRGALVEAVPLLGMDQIQAAPPAGLGIDGSGVKVAVLDSGIDFTHPDFAGALQAEACFCANPDNGDCCPNGNPTQFGAGAAADDHNHGTWVTGHIMGQGGVAPVGAAPGASLVAVKVLDSNNGFYSTADVTAALDWVAVNHPDVDVVNASLGTFATFSTQCDNETSWTMAMSQAVAALTANDALVVASAGNQANTNGIEVPSCLGEVIAVGATYKENLTGTFSSCGDVDPQIDDVACFSNHSAQLEIVAPGALMTTTQLGGGVSPAVSGTSFGAPLVAGCAALIREAHPELTWQQVRKTMVRSNVLTVDDRVAATLPRLNCLNAITLDLLEDRFEAAP